MQITPNLNALLISTFSGLSTGIGGLLVLLYGKPSVTKLGHLLSFSSGVMIYISFVDLLAEAVGVIGFFAANFWFFVGMLGFGLVAKLIPDNHDHGHNHKRKNKRRSGKPNQAMERIKMVGIITAIGLSLHNLPEGVAVYIASLKGTKVGLPLAFAIAAHNIPEGMAVASPIYHATGSKSKAFFYSLISGACEPLGALIFGFFFKEIDNYTIQCLLAAVAGVMILVSCQELMPIAFEYIKPEKAMISNAMGMIFISISIYMLHGSGGLHSHDHDSHSHSNAHGHGHDHYHDH
eukprot:TRINITY_DN6112_c0_g1_i2.p1 TRINITY_DN6112_c0_g1~~TRINITY_DN6112_c0_g1_i2.p1  ORF type:complete len:292 (-),score=36.96 TRINITY_DN6112_c0_g1_i2:22-897(-)